MNFVRACESGLAECQSTEITAWGVQFDGPIAAKGGTPRGIIITLDFDTSVTPKLVRERRFSVDGAQLTPQGSVSPP